MTRSREEAKHQSPAEQYQELCEKGGGFPDVAAFLKSADLDLRAKADVLLADQAMRISQGSIRPAEEYFALCPEVAANQALCLELVAGEYRGRTARGEAVPREGYFARFPQLRAHLARLLEPIPDFPSSGEVTVDVSPQAIRAALEESSSDAPREATRNDADDETLNVSAESIFAKPTADQADSFGKKGQATEEWEPTEEPSNPSGEGDDSNATLKMDAESLQNMMQQFDTGPLAGLDQTPATGNRVRGESDTPDTLFDEGAAYDESRPLGEFGGYDLLGEIARGGMGVVFKARQRKLKRIVALKMILAGKLADEEDVRRFYAEAEAAAGLDHPNIVPVYEVGQYRGQHFFSMGYVEGQSLAELVAEHPLSAKDAARMIKTIAEAVDYAHRHGVIHRDLKPANVLLDAAGQPKITDFGLAKRTEADAGLTTTGQLMGTPSYMSPEQVTGDSSQVGTSADVYALGGMLYCLLTGRPPFQAPSVLELLKQVQDSDPVSPKRLTANLPVDLETICLKCLAKEPHRRYESAQALADDLDRFLNGVPVLARPVGTAERVWRWCKRYPTVAGLMAAFVCSLILGAGFSTYYAIAASRRAKEAIAQYERAETNFERAERNFQKARAAVDQFFIQVSENTLLNQPGMQPLQHKLLSQALEYYQEFLKERSGDPELADELAYTHFRVGIITENVDSPEAAIPSLEAASKQLEELLESRPDDPELERKLGEALTALGRVYYRTNGHRHAEASFQEAAAVREKLARFRPEDREASRELANAFMNQGLVESGRAQSAESDKKKLAALEKAIDFYTKAQDLRRYIVKADGLSRDMLRKVHRDLGQGGYNLGRVHLQLGHEEAGLENYREAAAEFEKSLEIDPDDQAVTLQLATCYRVLAMAEADLAKAWEYCEKALSHLLPLVQANPRIADYRKELVSLYRDRGDIARGLKKSPEAVQAFAKSWRLADELRTEGDGDAGLLLIAVHSYRSLLELALSGQSQIAQLPAMEGLSDAIDQLPDRLAAENANVRLRGEFALEFFQLANLLPQRGQLKLAIEIARLGVRFTENLIEQEPGNSNHRFDHHLGLELLGRLAAEDRQFGEARTAYGDRLVALDELSGRLPDTADPLELAKLTFEKAKTHNALARIALAQNDQKQAVENLTSAKSLIDSLIADFPAHRAVFEQESTQTQRMLVSLKLPPASAEKPQDSNRDQPQ